MTEVQVALMVAAWSLVAMLIVALVIVYCQLIDERRLAQQRGEYGSEYLTQMAQLRRAMQACPRCARLIGPGTRGGVKANAAATRGAP